MKELPVNTAEIRSTYTRIHIDEPQAAAVFASCLQRYVQNHAAERPMLLVCIGSDRSTGDSLGPLIGSKVQNLRQSLFRVYGTLEQPVHATNLQETLEAIHREYKYENPFIIAIDACLGRVENIGCVNICEGALKPGAGVKKDLPPVGDIHITGIVNVGGFMEFTVLQNTRLNMVMRIADAMCAGLKLFLREHRPPSDLELPAAHEAGISETRAM